MLVILFIVHVSNTCILFIVTTNSYPTCIYMYIMLIALAFYFVNAAILFIVTLIFYF